MRFYWGKRPKNIGAPIAARELKRTITETTHNPFGSNQFATVAITGEVAGHSLKAYKTRLSNTNNDHRTTMG